MIDFTVIEASIYGIVQPILGCMTIFAEQSAPRPSGRYYATISVDNIRQLGREESSAPDSVTGVAYIWGHYELTVQFTAYGAGAKNAINSLQFAFNKDSVIDAFWNQGLAVVSHDSILDIPAIRDTIWEESSRFNAIFHVRIEDTDTTGVIEQVTVTGEFEGSVIDPLDTSTLVTIAP